MRIFISQPMGGKTEREIIQIREEIVKTLNENKSKYNIPPQEELEFIDSLLSDCSKGKIYCLGQSISLLQDADLVIFAKDWEKANGCWIEHEVCIKYKINYILY